VVAAVERYLENSELASAHGSAGRQRTLASFRPDSIWRHIHDTYSDLVAARPGRRYLVAKRAIDVIGASAVLAATIVPMAAVSVAIAAQMGRPVVFGQQRPGQHERLFRLYKFRTMTDARDANGALLPDGERITRLGAFLRRTSLDELPELFNVLAGELSLVGPRPLLVRYLPHFSAGERARHDALPGVTGWAQLHGRNEVSWDRRLAYDVWYVEHRTLLLDLEILLSTIGLVLGREGVVVDPHSTMLDFDEERIARRAAVPSNPEVSRGRG
jgi:lipopolysaccharide/colanic/teichoic acid biosynthesis glycosyltransferase